MRLLCWIPFLMFLKNKRGACVNFDMKNAVFINCLPSLCVCQAACLTRLTSICASVLCACWGGLCWQISLPFVIWVQGSVQLFIHPFNYQNVRSIFKFLLSLWLTGCVVSLFTTKRLKVWYIKYYWSLGQSCTHFQSDVNSRPRFNHRLWVLWGEQGWLDKKRFFSGVLNCCWGLLFHLVVNEQVPVSAKGLQCLFPTLASS